MSIRVLFGSLCDYGGCSFSQNANSTTADRSFAIGTLAEVRSYQCSLTPSPIPLFKSPSSFPPSFPLPLNPSFPLLLNPSSFPLPLNPSQILDGLGEHARLLVQLYETFVTFSKPDQDDEVCSNSIYALGVLAANALPEMLP